MRHIFLAPFVFFLLFSIGGLTSHVAADTKQELEAKITERNKAIAELEKEIALYAREIEKTSREAGTLQGVLKSLDTSSATLASKIKITENKIVTTEFEIKKLSLEIQSRESTIETHRGSIAKLMRTIRSSSDASIVEALLGYDELSELWSHVDSIMAFNGALQFDIKNLESERVELAENKLETEVKRVELSELRKDLFGERQAIEGVKKEKSSLLKETKNKEVNYRKIVTEKMALKEAFEKELHDFETSLKLNVDLSKLPRGSGALAWPLDSIKITQEFGDTEFSRSRPGLYSGLGHNGIDFAAPIGTRIKAAEAGIIEGTGDTDVVCPGASYGRWVLIKHQNGLATLYAHLSVISGRGGQSVSKGEVVGYSGSTGYSTGPHLHFTVYAADGVQILSRKSKVCGGTYTMPVADLRAYLNPMFFL